jgi:hypothetical protein
MKNIHIENSYNIWATDQMWNEIVHQSHLTYDDLRADIVLNRSYEGMYIEWYLHNIGYILTLPFCFSKKIKKLNERFKHLDLEEHF